MESKLQIAEDKFNHMYNCCQSVICCYCEEFGLEEKDVFRMTEGFVWEWEVLKILAVQLLGCL